MMKKDYLLESCEMAFSKLIILKETKLQSSREQSFLIIL